MDNPTNTFLKYAILSGVFSILFIVLNVSSSMFFPFITGKNFTFRIVVEIIFALWLILAIRDSNFRPRFSGILAAFMAFLSIMAIATLHSENPSKSFWSNYERMDGYITQIHLFAYFLVLGSTLTTRAIWDKIFNTSLLVSYIISSYGLIQLAGLFQINQGGVRVDATFGNATYLAIYLVIHIFFAIIYFLRDGSFKWSSAEKVLISIFSVLTPIILFLKVNSEAHVVSGGGVYIALAILVPALLIALSFVSKRYVYGLLMVLFSIVLYHTATRGAILGLIGGLLLMALLIALFEKTNKGLRKFSTVVIVAIMILVGVFVLVKNSSFVQNSPVLSRFASISLNENKTQARAYVWPMAIKGFEERPIFGWGQESFNYVFNKYYDPRMYRQEPWFDRTHNVVLDWLIAGGIFGLLGYLSLYGLAMYAIWRKGDLIFSEKAALTGLFAAYFFHNIFVFDNLTSYMLFMLLLGFLHFDTARDFNNKLSSKISEALENAGMISRIAAPIVVVLMVYSIYFFNAKPIAANATLIQAISSQVSVDERINLFKTSLAYNTFGNQEIREQLVQLAFNVANNSSNIEQRSKIYSYTKDEYEKMIKEEPNDTRHHLFLGALDNLFGNIGEGIKELEIAHKLSPGKQTITSEIGNAYIAMGQYDKALPYFKEAFEADEDYEEVRFMYAAAAIYARRDDIVRSILLTKYGTIYYPDDHIVRAYMDTNQFDKAVITWQNAIKSEPLNARNRIGLAAVYLKIGDKSSAIRMLTEAVSVESNPQLKAQYQSYLDGVKSGSINI